MRILIGAAILLCAGAIWAGSSLWTLEQSPTTETLNGISGSSEDFIVAVGENGAIVHFVDGDSGTLVPSGTTNELFDVFVASPDLAVATGSDIVLTWDGSAWSPILETSNGSTYTGTWISPEQDVILYGSLGVVSLVCPYLPNDPNPPPFCRTFVAPMVAACGQSDDIKIITSDGDIWRVDNFLADIDSAEPIHDEPGSLGLTAVWAPAYACLPGPIEPLDLFAIRNGNEFWRFDGADWSNMNVSVPGDQTLTWLAGTGPGNIVASGFKPDGSGGNQAVIWTYDGSAWAEDTDLPAGAPGLTDVGTFIGEIDAIFASGFEGDAGIRSRLGGIPLDYIEQEVIASAEDVEVEKVFTVPLDYQEVIASAEDGGTLRTSELFPRTPYDLAVEKTLLTQEPIQVGDRVRFELEVSNLGPETAVDVELLDYYLGTSLSYISDTCGSSPSTQFFATFGAREVRIPSLQPVQTVQCIFEFDATATFLIRNTAVIVGAGDINDRNNESTYRFNNESTVGGVTIRPAD